MEALGTSDRFYESARLAIGAGNAAMARGEFEDAAALFRAGAKWLEALGADCGNSRVLKALPG